MSENISKAETKQMQHMVLKVCVDGRVQELQVPINDDFKACLKDVAAMRAELKTQKDEPKGPEYKQVLQIAKALTEAVEDCEHLVKMLREPVDGVDCELARQADEIAMHYEQWRAKAPKPLDENNAPLFAVRFSRPLNASAAVDTKDDQQVASDVKISKVNTDEEAQGAVDANGAKDQVRKSGWKGPHVIDLRNQELYKRLSGTSATLFQNIGLHKNACRVLWIERSFSTPEFELVLGYYTLFAIEADYRTEMHAIESAEIVAKGATAPVLKPLVSGAPRNVVFLMTDMKCDHVKDIKKGQMNKDEQAAHAKRVRGLFDMATKLFHSMRHDKRNERLCAKLPALVGAGLAMFAVKLAPLYDINGINVPSQALILELGYHDDMLDLDRSALIKHSQLSLLMNDMLARVKHAEAQWHQIEDKNSPEAYKAFLFFEKYVADYETLIQTDRLARSTNTRNEIVFSIVEYGSGIDAKKTTSARLIRGIRVEELIKTTERLKNSMDSSQTSDTAAPAPAVVPAETQAPVAPAETQAPVTPAEAQHATTPPAGNTPSAR